MELTGFEKILRERLLQEGITTAERFDELAFEAERKNQKILDLLVSEKVADISYLYGILAEFSGVELANLAVRKINEDALRLLEEEVSRRREAIIFDKEADGTLDVALLDPTNLETIQFLTEHLKTKIKSFLATPDDLNRGYSFYGSKSTEDFKRIVEENVQASLRSQSKSSEEAAAELPIVAIVDNILSYALALRTSDIHLEVLDDVTLIRYRVDGILYEVIRIPKSVHPALVARIKILSGLKIDEHYRPQDGRFRYQIVNQIVDIRVSVMPTYYGEKIALRLLEAAQKPLSLEELGMLNQVAVIVKDNLKKSYGMILSCGPTGSGKTTTLYALMNILNRPKVNIVTIEDPVEYNMRYVNQSQINPQTGITFATGLRALLRQDPNVLMVGEIRDKETAGIAVQAALTGHLVLSSLHTNDAPTAIPRFIDLDTPPFLLASTLNLVIAQRLVRKVCNSCIYSYSPDSTEGGLDVRQAILSEAKVLQLPGAEALVPKTVYRGKGCSACNFSGYRGRFGIFEILEVTDRIKEVVMSPQFNMNSLWLEARAEGTQTMFEDGLQKVQLGLTTVEEVLRVIRE